MPLFMLSNIQVTAKNHSDILMKIHQDLRRAIGNIKVVVGLTPKVSALHNGKGKSVWVTAGFHSHVEPRKKGKITKCMLKP